MSELMYKFGTESITMDTPCRVRGKRYGAHSNTACPADPLFKVGDAVRPKPNMIGRTEYPWPDVYVGTIVAHDESTPPKYHLHARYPAQGIFNLPDGTKVSAFKVVKEVTPLEFEKVPAETSVCAAPVFKVVNNLPDGTKVSAHETSRRLNYSVGHLTEDEHNRMGIWCYKTLEDATKALTQTFPFAKGLSIHVALGIGQALTSTSKDDVDGSGIPVIRFKSIVLGNEVFRPAAPEPPKPKLVRKDITTECTFAWYDGINGGHFVEVKHGTTRICYLGDSKLYRGFSPPIGYTIESHSLPEGHEWGDFSNITIYKEVVE